MHHFDYDRVAELRKKLIPYEKVEEFVHPGRDDVILDVGAGDGFYSVGFASRITDGKVIALDISESGAERTRKRMVEEGVQNVEVLRQDVCADFSVTGYNKVFFSNSFHDIPCRDELIDTLFRNSSPPLEIILIEFRTDKDDFGPPMEIRIGEKALQRIFEGHGFRLDGRLELDHHYLHRYVRK